jgi:hypothetical protein
MSIQTQLFLSQSGKGRVALHLLALNQDLKFGWHLKGILREINRIQTRRSA